MPNPLDALKKASGIGPDPLRSGVHLQGGMPMPPVTSMLAGLRDAMPMISEASERIAPVAETLGEINPQFTPAGGEGLYNVAKEGIKHPVDSALAAYHAILARGGR